MLSLRAATSRNPAADRSFIIWVATVQTFLQVSLRKIENLISGGPNKSRGLENFSKKLSGGANIRDQSVLSGQLTF